MSAQVPRGIEDFADRLEPLGRILNMMELGYAMWSCCPIYDETGRVHVFVTYWEHEGDYALRPDVGMGLRGKIGHAVAERPEGPYTWLDTALAAGEQDAWDGSGVSEGFVYKVDDRYAMYYFGNNWLIQPTTPRQIGLAVADSLDGPWQRVNDGLPIIPVASGDEEPDSLRAVNPGMTRGPDGAFWLYYKGVSKADKQRQNAKGSDAWRRICLARAEKLQGPYVKHPDNPIMDYGDADFEDPFVWHDGERFHMLVHDLSVYEHGAGLYFQSFDGVHWSEPAKGYPSTKTMYGLEQRLEEPAVLFGPDGEPEYLFCNRSWPELHHENPHNPIYTGFVFKIHRRSDMRVSGMPPADNA